AYQASRTSRRSLSRQIPQLVSRPSGRVIPALLLALVWSLSALAQGVQTGTIRGAVRDQDGLVVPGVTLTATSAVLQGQPTMVTDSEGGFTLAGLPPGTYELKFEFPGFTTVTRSVVVSLGLPVELNVLLRPAAVSEQVSVVAETPAPIASPVVGANFNHD